MLRTFLLLLMLSLAFPVLAQDREKKMAKAQKLYDRGKFSTSTKFLNNCIQDDPDYSEYYFLRSFCFWYMGNSELALKDINMTIKLHPDSSKYILNRATYYYKSFEFYKATEDYKTAIPLQKNKSDSSFVMALAGGSLQVLGDTLGALIMLENAIEVDSTNSGALTNYALLLCDLNEFEKSVNCLKRIGKNDSLYISSLMNIGYVYGVQGEYLKSIPYLDQALALSPNEPYAYNNRGYAKLKTGNTDGALIDVKKSLELNPYNSYAYRNLGLIYLEQGKNDEACKAFATALHYKFTELYGPEVNELRKKHCRE